MVDPMVGEGVVEPTENVGNVNSSKPDENDKNIKVADPLVDEEVVEPTENVSSVERNISNENGGKIRL